MSSKVTVGSFEFKDENKEKLIQGINDEFEKEFNRSLEDGSVPTNVLFDVRNKFFYEGFTISKEDAQELVEHRYKSFLYHSRYVDILATAKLKAYLLKR